MIGGVGGHRGGVRRKQAAPIAGRVGVMSMPAVARPAGCATARDSRGELTRLDRL